MCAVKETIPKSFKCIPPYMYISVHQIQTKTHHCNRRLGSSTGEGEDSTGEMGPGGHREVPKKSLLLSL